MANPTREGNLEAPTRHPIDWKNPEFYNEDALFDELERVFDICHGCRRCFNLCQSFPKLFDAIDDSDTMEIDGISKADYWQTVDHCYLCDMCYMTKCPYVPPHEFNLDFPHLMLRAKALKFKQGETKLRDKILTSTDTIGNLLGIPVVAGIVNAANKNKPLRKLNQKILGIHADAKLPDFHSNSLYKRDKNRTPLKAVRKGEQSTGKIALFATCYINHNEPHIGEDLIKVFEHNGIMVSLAEKEQCCGMPKLELGDLESVDKAKQNNIPLLAALVDKGFDIVAPIPSCVLMFKQELPLLYPDDAEVKKVQAAIYDPFEYLMLRHKEGLLKTEFKQGLGKIAYQVACHLRVQNIGLKTRDVLSLIPNTEVDAIERCSGHNGTYAVKAETHADSMKILKPVLGRVTKAEADHYSSDCPMAGHHIENGLGADANKGAEHPLSLLRQAYGL